MYGDKDDGMGAYEVRGDVYVIEIRLRWNNDNRPQGREIRDVSTELTLGNKWNTN